MDDPLVELVQEIAEEMGDDDEPTPEQIHAAMAAAETGPATIYKPAVAKKKFSKPRNKRPYNRRKKPDA